jgi:hypothetical protein
VTRRWQLGLLFLIVVVIAFTAARLRYPGRASVTVPASSCDASLWQHTYQNQRLPVITPCTAVEGRVVSVHFNDDGDVHLELVPDDRRVLNLINATHMHGNLVAEIVCEHQPKDVPDSQNACIGFHSSVQLPKAGDRVRITGAYVTDRDNGWREIHPVSRIDLLH